GLLLHSPMDRGALQRVLALGPLPLHPLEVEETRAVDELVEHPRRHEVGGPVLGRCSPNGRHIERIGPGSFGLDGATWHASRPSRACYKMLQMLHFPCD